MKINKPDRLRSETGPDGNIETAVKKSAEADNCLLKAGNREDNGLRSEKDLLIEAVGLYHEAIKIYPRLPEPYIGLAHVCYLSGNLKKAVSFLYNALDIDPDNPVALDRLPLYKNELEKATVKETPREITGQFVTNPVYNLPAFIKKFEYSRKINSSKNFLDSLARHYSDG
jgi:tetratricopeptide (TPR) repeat protein